jgi:Acetoacetate decarboxylase (ADC)
MPGQAESAPRPAESWRNPWPLPVRAWADPPWEMRGRSLTAWFQAPWAALESVLSPDLLPARSRSVLMRIRFYDLEFRALGGVPEGHLAPLAGRVREAVVAVPALAGVSEGDATLFMWCDSDPYLLWGREVFGWPLARGEIRLEGDLWSPALSEGARGDCELDAEDGRVAVLGVRVGRPVEGGVPVAGWIAPRRRFDIATGEDVRDVTITWPRIVDPGVRLAAVGEGRIEFRPPHPLAGVVVERPDIHVADGFVLVVGEKVDVVRSSERSTHD